MKENAQLYLIRHHLDGEGPDIKIPVEETIILGKEDQLGVNCKGIDIVYTNMKGMITRRPVIIFDRKKPLIILSRDTLISKLKTTNAGPIWFNAEDL